MDNRRQAHASLVRTAPVRLPIVLLLEDLALEFPILGSLRRYRTDDYDSFASSQRSKGSMSAVLWERMQELVKLVHLDDVRTEFGL